MNPSDAPNLSNPVLSGLIRKRAEVAGGLEAAQQRVRQLIIDIDNVDATIRLFAPDIDLEEIRPKPLPPRHAAFKALRDFASAMAVSSASIAGFAMPDRLLEPAVAAEREP